jgi:hypothetical protein
MTPGEQGWKDTVRVDPVMLKNVASMKRSKAIAIRSPRSSGRL